MHERDDETTFETSSGIDSVESIPEGVLKLDHVFDSIAESRCRYLLYSLKSKQEWTVAELATKVRAWEMDVSESEVSETEAELTHTSLYHAHIPRLVDNEVIEFDGESETIHPGENAKQVLAVLAGAGASLDTNQEDHARGEMDDESD